MFFYGSWWIICFFNSARIICSFMSFFKRRTCFVIMMADILISSRLTFSPSRKNVSPKTLTLSAHLLLKVLRAALINHHCTHFEKEKKIYIYMYKNSINKQDQYWEDCQPPQWNVYFEWQVDLAGNGKNIESLQSCLSTSGNWKFWGGCGWKETGTLGDVVLCISTSISANYLDKLYSESEKSEMMLEGT